MGVGEVSYMCKWGALESTSEASGLQAQLLPPLCRFKFQSANHMPLAVGRDATTERQA